MLRDLWLLVVSVPITSTGGSTGSRTLETGSVDADATWVNEDGWGFDGRSCRIRKEIQ